MILASVSDWRVTPQTLAYLAQVIALIVGGAWTYRIFIKQRSDHARANISHSAIVLGETKEHRLVRIEITVTNVGNVLLVPPGGKTTIEQVEPLPASVEDILPLPTHRKSDCQLPWEQVASVSYKLNKYQLALDPGETDAILCDFALPLDVKAIFVRTELDCRTADNPDDKWRATSFHRLSKTVEGQTLTFPAEPGASIGSGGVTVK